MSLLFGRARSAHLSGFRFIKGAVIITFRDIITYFTTSYLFYYEIFVIFLKAVSYDEGK